jgi:multidrug transporter EmrE-like cation transporter
MFGTFRNIASVILVVLMGICAIALVMNEYHDANRIGQELCMENCLEPDADESEWDDENDIPDGAIGSVTLCPLYILHPDISVPANSSARRSLKQMRGLPLTLPHGSVGWFYVGWLALVPGIFALVLMVYAAKYVGSTATAILGALEPLTAVLIGLFVFGEPFTVFLAVGIVLILAAVVLVALAKQKKQTEKNNAANVVAGTTPAFDSMRLADKTM